LGNSLARVVGELSALHCLRIIAVYKDAQQHLLCPRFGDEVIDQVEHEFRMASSAREYRDQVSITHVADTLVTDNAIPGL
jgi:hypothetical protein